jgi:hypothetical protein
MSDLLKAGVDKLTFERDFVLHLRRQYGRRMGGFALVVCRFCRLARCAADATHQQGASTPCPAGHTISAVT